MRDKSQVVLPLDLEISQKISKHYAFPFPLRREKGSFPLKHSQMRPLSRSMPPRAHDHAPALKNRCPDRGVGLRKKYV